MTNTIWILLALLTGIVALMWTKMRGKSLDDLFAEAGAEHHRVHDVLTRHPKGGTWRAHRQRMAP